MMHDEALVAAVMLCSTMKTLLDGGGGHARKIGCLSIICTDTIEDFNDSIMPSSFP